MSGNLMTGVTVLLKTSTFPQADVREGAPGTPGGSTQLIIGGSAPAAIRDRSMTSFLDV